MGRGDNRRTLKIRRRKAQRRRKAAVQKAIAAGKTGTKTPKSAAPATENTTIRRSGE